MLHCRSFWREYGLSLGAKKILLIVLFGTIFSSKCETIRVRRLVQLRIAPFFFFLLRKPDGGAAAMLLLPLSGHILSGAGPATVPHIHGRLFQGGEAVSKTACGGFDSQPSVPDV